MKFGIFYEHQLPRPWGEGDELQLFQDALAQVELADRLGLDYAWEVEHHFLEEYSHSSAPEVFLAAASQRTQRIRLGHGIVLMPPGYNQPARVAERIATLDLVSRGRVDWGTGESASRAELEGYGVNPAERRAMWRETVEQVANMMVMEPYPGFKGQYFSMPARNVVPKPVQKPHPPIWVACSNRETIHLAAQLGIGALTFAFIDPAEAKQWVDDYYETFKRECVPIGHAVNPNIAMVTGFSCHRDAAEAQRRGADGFRFFQFALAHHYVFGKHTPGRTNIWNAFLKVREQLGTEVLGGGVGCIGSPDDLRGTLRVFQDAGVDQTIFIQQGGKRLRIFLSDNNAGIDDSLIGGVVASKFTGYRLVDQWTSYGWNVFTLPDGHDYEQIVSVMKKMEEWDPTDRRPMIVIGKTIKGYWPGAVNGKIPGAGDQVVGFPSHPYAMKMNSEYFVSLCQTFEKKYGVEFAGIRKGAVTDPAERLVQFKTNIDVVMSVLEQNGLGDWLAERLVQIGDLVKDELPTRADVKHDPFLDERLKVANLPEEPQTLTVRNPVSGAEKQLKIALFRKAGEVAGARRGISEMVKWINHVTGNRVVTLSADLSESINLEHGSIWGHYDPETNPVGTRLKAAIQEAGNASSAIGLVSQSASVDPEKFAGVWAFSGTYGAFTPLMYTPARVWSQQNQDLSLIHI